MKVKLVSYTKSVIEEADSLDELIAYVARVSNPSNQHNKETADKLVNYLVKHKHFSPLEMANACFEIETTRDIARQILRHRSFSFQEFSQRYANVKDIGLFELREARLQDHKNRQNSIETDDRILQADWEIKQMELMNKSESVYKWAINNGIAKEQARAVLPEGITPSRMYMNGSLRSWLHYIEVRTDPSTQKEHREVAQEIQRQLIELAPNIFGVEK